MKRIFSTIAVLVAMAGPVSAQDWQYLYSTLLGPADFTNSSGARLGDLCAIVQQDRANFHRFNLRDQADSSDAYFGSRSERARIPGMCQLADGFDYIRRDVLNGTPRYIGVYGRFNGSGQLVAIRILEGAG